MITINDIKGLSNIHDIPKAIHLNKGVILDPFLEDNLSGTPKTVEYDFDVYLKDYGVNLQRPYVWNLIQQQEFILSILLDKPIPPVVVVDIDNGQSLARGERTKRLVIDGKQRLLTIKRFLNNEFPIPIGDGLYTFESFDTDMKHLFCHQISYLEANVYYASEDKKWDWYISDDMKIILFNFYNFAGTPQEKYHQEMLQDLLKK